ncbi:MAG: hypothetical protein ACOZAR_03325 [Patescibacteria group bacterium]
MSYLYWGIIFAILWFFLRKAASDNWLLFIKIISITFLVSSLIIYIEISFFSTTKTTTDVITDGTKNQSDKSLFNSDYLLEPTSNLNTFGCSSGGYPSIF